MRIFITKQNTNRPGRVAGHIRDDDAKPLDELEDDPEEREAHKGTATWGYRLTESIDDCDYWDGTPKELLAYFEDTVRYLNKRGVKGSNDLHRLKSAENAIEYLKIAEE